jgi:hypothetical protein
MYECDYEVANQHYPYCVKIRGTLKYYMQARSWAEYSFGMDCWDSAWTMQGLHYMDDQVRDWLFLFKSHDNYAMFMLAWHYDSLSD